MIPFLDLEAATEEIRPDLDEALARVLSSGWFVLGREVEAFEAEFATFVDTNHCVGVGNGLDAIELALRALGVRAGDEVIVPSNTYIATWLAVTRVGAIVVPVEPDLATYNIDPNRVEAAVTPERARSSPSICTGNPRTWSRSASIASQRGLWLVEDAAQAHGATYAAIGQWAGWPMRPHGASIRPRTSAASATAVPSRPNDPDVADRVRLLRNYGSRVKYVNEIIGSNSRLDELQAAALRVKLPHLLEWNERRRRVAERYRSELADVPICLPSVAEGGDHVWHLFVIRSAERDRLQQHLTECGVQTLLHYPMPPHLQDAYRDLGLSEGDLPIAEADPSRVPEPSHRAAHQRPQVDAVIQAVRSFRH